jgi:hypothetical protein
MLMMSLRELPHIGACTGVVLQTKVETKDGLYWFDNHRAFIQKQIFHFFVTMSVAQKGLDQYCIS